MYESLLIQDDFDDIECLSSANVSAVSACLPAELTREPWTGGVPAWVSDGAGNREK